ncbi:tailspike protein [Proteus phage vB_PmiP_Pm5460]|uniref:Tailspike protein n=1 Tax=Proteus phage vB_PmiP_Pm5460 TaxID=1636249 RepID=A0A0G2SSF0_9CAUD|nr:tail spike protein [Proteus phage vB_PmiP_Pm5460]AKA61861.1 tailspike protein [Proteus phage vB_PmiP_Pm5460]
MSKFTQPRGSVAIYTNKDSVARKFGCLQSEVAYARTGESLGGCKVIYDELTQKSYALPPRLGNVTVVSLTNGTLIHSSGSVDLGALAVQRGEFNKVLGDFASGFTIDSKNDEVIYNNIRYLWEGELPKVVTANSSPSTTGGFGNGKWVASGVDEIQGFINPPPIYIDSSTASVPSIEDSYMYFGANANGLQQIELIAKAGDSGDFDVYMYGEMPDVINTSTAEGAFVLYGVCDGLDRSNYGTVSEHTIVSLTDNMVHIRFPLRKLTDSGRTYFAFAYRTASGYTFAHKIDKVIVKQKGKILARTHFNLIGDSATWTPTGTSTKSVLFGEEFKLNLQLDQNVSYLKSSGIVPITPDGASSYLQDKFRLSFVRNSMRALFSTALKEFHLKAGDYYEDNVVTGFSVTSNTRIISIGGYSNIYLGKYLRTGRWEEVQNKPRYTYKAPYDWATNPDQAIRNGTKQPFLGVEVVAGRTKSMRDYKLTNVKSKEEVLAKDFTYWYDYNSKEIYWSFGSENDLAYVYVAEAVRGLQVTGSVVCTASGINFYGCKDNPFHIQSDNYKSYTRGGGLLSLHNCEAHGSYGANGFYLSNVDAELVNCKAYSVNNDGFNCHNAGIMNIVGGGSYYAGDDGASPHENCIMYITDADLHYSFAGNYTIAFGATGYGYRLSSITADRVSTKPYSGTLSVLAGQDQRATGYFLDCYTNTRGVVSTDYYAQSQQEGQLARIYISRMRRSNTSISCITAGRDTQVQIS